MRRAHRFLLVSALLLVGLAAVPSADGAVVTPRDTPVSGGLFVPVDPVRILGDTLGTNQLEPSAETVVQVAGTAGVPATGVSAVVVTVVAGEFHGSGYLTVYPDGEPRPTASNLNLYSLEAVSNLVTVKLGTDGAIRLANRSSGEISISVDLRGFYTAGTASAAGSFTPVSPTRVLDTRSGNGAPVGALADGHAMSVSVLGRGGLPAANVSAVVANVTAVQPGGSGYLTVYPSGSTRPTASTLQLRPGRVTPNLVTVKVGADGKLSLYNGSAKPVHLVVDIAGYYLAGTPTLPGTFASLAPVRILDTRSGFGIPAAGGDAAPIRRFNPSVHVGVLGHYGVPATAVAALVVNVTAVAPGGYGELGVLEDGTFPGYAFALPIALVMSPGLTSATLTVSRPGVDGGLQLNTDTTTDAVADLAGYFLAAPASAPFTWENPVSADPAFGSISSLACSSSTECTGIDDSGAIVRRTSAGWQRPIAVPGLDQPETWLPVSCPTADSCAALSDDGSFFTFDANGVATRHRSTTAYPEAFSCGTPTFCVSVDLHGITTVWNGTQWRAAGQGPDGVEWVHQLSCLPGGRCLGVTYNGVTWFDGARWSTVTILNTSKSIDTELRTGSCATPSFCAVGDVATTAYMFNGQTWSKTTMGPGFALSCPVAGWCLALGSGSARVYANGGWQSITPSGLINTQISLSCWSTAACAVTDGRQVVELTGTTWSAPDVIDGYGSPTGLSCPAPDSCAVVDLNGALTSLSPSGWAPSQRVTTLSMGRVSCPTTTFCLATASPAWVRFAGPDATSASFVPRPTFALAVLCVDPQWCLGVGVGGQVAIYDGAGWSAPVIIDPQPSATPDNELDLVSCASRDFCVAIDRVGRSLVDHGGTWSNSTILGPKVPTALSCPSADFCEAVSGSVSYQWDGTVWVSGILYPQADLTSVSCSGSTHCVALDSTGAVLVFDGLRWTPEPTGLPAPASNGLLSCPTTGFCVVGDDAGRFVIGRR